MIVIGRVHVRQSIDPRREDPELLGEASSEHEGTTGHVIYLGEAVSLRTGSIRIYAGAQRKEIAGAARDRLLP